MKDPKIILFLVSLSVSVFFCKQKNDSDLNRLFTQAQVKGTLILSSLDGKKEYIYNKKRSLKEFSPASTFKIANTLISLEENLLPVNHVFKWDGVKRRYPVWNQNQTLKSAYARSCVWCYQQLAQKAGADKYIKHLKKINYGTIKENFNLTEFWLNNELTISARQQITFLKKVYLEKLPYQKKYFKRLKATMIEVSNKKYTIRAKTGFSARVQPFIAWYVGYVTSQQGVWFFALNMEVSDIKKLKMRKELVTAALKAKGII